MALGVRKREKEGQKEPTRSFSKKQENAIAKAVGGSRQPNSGATPWEKGDVVINGENGFLLEAKTKTTHVESFSIKKEWFDKNKREAAFMGKPHTALVFNFGPGEENHYIIDEYLFLELLDYLKTQ